MEGWKWRYHPEFRVHLMIDGQPALEAFNIVAITRGRTSFDNYGLISRPYPSGIVCHQLQKPDGNNWIPAVDLTQAERFQFWIFKTPTMDLSALTFFASASGSFGRPTLYANNLDATGSLDTNLVGNTVSLTSGNAAANSERAYATAPIIGTEITPAAFTELRAGQVLPGGPVTFSVIEQINVTHTRASLDLTLEPAGAWTIELNGGAPITERAVVDQRFASSNAIALVEIYRDAWLSPPQPRNYQLNFSTV